MASTQLQNILTLIQREWGITVSADRIAGWEDELANGTGRGRTMAQLRADIFKYVVGEDRVKQYIRDAFEEAGVPLTAGEDADIEARLTRIAMELGNGTKQFNTLVATIQKAAGMTDQGGGVTTKPVDPPDADPPSVGTGSVTILTSKDMKWYYDKSTNTWAVAYKMPGSNRYMVFEASPEEMDNIFGEGQRPTDYTDMPLGDVLQQEGYTYGGNILDVQGTGTFEGEVERVIALALDEGILPPWAQESDAVLDLLYIAHSEGKSDEWLIEEISKLPEFKARFPGLETMIGLGLTISEAVSGFLELESGVKELILRDGGDPDSVTPEMIGDLVSQGHSLTDVQQVYKMFERMANNQGALDAFNEVLAARGMEPLTEDEQFEFLAGNAPAELYQIWEETSLHQAAIDAGLDIGVEAAVDLANRTEGRSSYDQALEGLSNAAANILRFRDQIGLDQYGLNEQDLIDLSLGLAPSSGASQAEIGRNMERAFGGAKATRDRQRSNPFKRFSDQGVPQSASLSGVRQESS